MSLNNQLSPEVAKILIVCVGLSAAFFLWSGLGKVQQGFQAERVLGENQGGAQAVSQAVITTLPIVEVSVQQASMSGDDAPITSDMLEAAFKEPVPLEPVEPEEKELVEVPPEEPLLSKAVTSYRPSVNAITDGGAFIGGAFWRVGEEIKIMPMRNKAGEVVYPHLAKLLRGGVLLSLEGATHKLTFDYY